MLALGLFLGFGGLAFIYNAPKAHALTEQEKAKLQGEYDAIQKEIAQWQKVLDETRAKKNTLQGDVKLLDAQIKKAEAEIRSRSNTIARLADEISQKSRNLSALEQQLEEGRQSLAELLREKHETETTSLTILALSAQGLSEFFSAVDAVDSLNRKLQAHFDELRGVREETQKQKEELAVRRDMELDAKYEVEVKKKVINDNKKEKNELLSITKKEESAYQGVLAERQRRAEQIRAALFDLRDAQGISFASALDYAVAASQQTGVRPALILAILSQESDLGKNIGSCYVTNLDTGDGVGKNTGTFFEKVMKSPRDTSLFEQIASTLSIPWASTPVSCPLGKVYSASRGYGGAMGPSQFIPSTWKLFEPKIRAALGTELPNPWNAGHAVMATALYLRDLGAASGGYSAERNAACRYYSGRSCDSRSPVNYTYGNSVIAKAETFQENIDFLKGI